MGISVDVNFGINVTEYGMATVTFPKACQPSATDKVSDVTGGWGGRTMTKITPSIPSANDR